MTQSLKTEIIYKSLSPTWDQTLIFDTVEIHGNSAEIATNPPHVMIEIFDHDPNVRKQNWLLFKRRNEKFGKFEKNKINSFSEMYLKCRCYLNFAQIHFKKTLYVVNVKKRSVVVLWY